MSTPLRALLIDDSEEDTELLLRHLRRNGFDVQWVRVDTAPALEAALAQPGWDVALCDYMMPHLRGPEALRILRARAPALPAITISGQVGEEFAVDVMRAGARDYVRKDNLARLVPAIERELADAEVQRGRRRAEADLRIAESWLQVATDSTALGLFDYDPRTGATFFSPRWKANLGHAPTEIADRMEELEDRLHADDRDRVLANVRAQVAGQHPFLEMEFRLRHRDGSYRWFLFRSATHTDTSAAVAHILGCALDITERRQMVDRLRVSEERHRLLADNARDVIWTMDLDGTISYVSPSVEQVRGFTPDEAKRQTLEEIHPPESRVRSQEYFAQLQAAVAAGRRPASFRGEMEYYCRDGSTFWSEVMAYPILAPDGSFVEILGVTRDISERKRHEQELQAARDAAEAANRANRELLADMRREIRGR